MSIFLNNFDCAKLKLCTLTDNLNNKNVLGKNNKLFLPKELYLPVNEGYVLYKNGNR